MEKYLPLYEKNFFERTEKNISCEIDLPEYLPNAVKIVRVSAKGFTDECEVMRDSLTVKGHIVFSAVYLSDFHGKLKCVTGTSEFSHTFPAKGIGDTVNESGFCECGCTVSEEKGQISSRRKLSLICKAALCAEAVCIRKTELFEVPDEGSVHTLCESTEFLERTAPNPCEITLEDSIALDAGMPGIREIAFSDCEVSSVSASISSGKIMYSGNVTFNCLYLADDDTDEHYIAFSKELPFSASSDCDSFADSTFIICKAALSAVNADPVQNNFGDSDSMSVSAKITVCPRVFGVNTAETISDAFSTKHECSCEFRNIPYDRFVCGINENVTEEISAKANLGSITDIVSVSPSIIITSPELYGKLPVFNARLTLMILGTNGNGGLESISTSIPVKLQSKNELQVIPEKYRFDSEAFVGNCECRIENGEIKCSLTVNICSCIYERTSVRTVTAMELDKTSEFSRDKSEYILYYPCAGDSVWSCARKYRVSPKALLLVNGMENTDSDFGGRKSVVIPRAES